jgi:hypothetical protein
MPTSPFGSHDDARADAGGVDVPTSADVRVFAHHAAAWLDGADADPLGLSYRTGYLSQMLSGMAKGQLSIQQATRMLKDRTQGQES